MNILSAQSYKINITHEHFGYEWVVRHIIMLPHILAFTPNERGSSIRNNMCPGSTPECRAHCLINTGRMNFPSVRKAARMRTRMLMFDSHMFFETLHDELDHVLGHKVGRNQRLAVRLNTTSDYAFEQHPEFFERYGNVRFYDYTKVWGRMKRFLEGRFPPNYTLTWSYSGMKQNLKKSCEVLERGGSVTVPYMGPTLRLEHLPTSMASLCRGIVDGDTHDLRFLDPPSSVASLHRKIAAGSPPTHRFFIDATQ